MRNESRLPLALTAAAALVALAMLLGVGGAAAADAAEVKVEGFVISNTGDAIVVRDLGGKTINVMINDQTDVRSKNPGLGVIRKGKQYAAEALVPGLEVVVEATPGSDGNLVAQKVRFGKKDLQMAQAIQAGVNPVEQQAAATQQQADATAAQMGDITKMELRKEVTVNFDVNSTALSSVAKDALDEVAALAKNLGKGFLVEIRGFADASGNAEHNLALSKRRAESVTTYLQMHDIPLRQIVTPAGLGDTRAVGDNSTDSGRAANRRVEVKLLASKGLQPS